MIFFVDVHYCGFFSYFLWFVRVRSTADTDATYCGYGMLATNFKVEMTNPENSKYLFLVIILIFSFSCGNKEIKIIDKRNGLDYPNFEERNNGLGNVLNRQDTLKIFVEFSECGEWGGHMESLFLKKKF